MVGSQTMKMIDPDGKMKKVWKRKTFDDKRLQLVKRNRLAQDHEIYK